MVRIIKNRNKMEQGAGHWYNPSLEFKPQYHKKE
jgi:hypothetical protein